MARPDEFKVEYATEAVAPKWAVVAKRTLDMVASLIAILVLSPLGAILVVLIVVDSWGSPFYISRRIGRGGRQFPLIKFRTMIVGAEDWMPALRHFRPEFDAYWKLTDDPRITRVGRWLRRSSLDEVPQFINVLWGQMSLVGPRPIVSEELSQYSPNEARDLLSVRPGLTGLWQTRGRSTIAYPERTRMELEYVQEWSLRLDLRILWHTLPTVLSRRGAL